MPLINMFFETNSIGSKQEDGVDIDDNEWASLSADQKQEMLDELGREFMLERVDYGAYVVDEEE